MTTDRDEFVANNPRTHWEAFPHDREVPDKLLQELTGIILHAGVGTLGPEFDVI